MHGSFQKNGLASDLFLATATSKMHGITFSILVHKEDGTIFDAKYLASAPPFAIGICEILAENFLRKTYAQIANISADYIQKLIFDKAEQPLLSTTDSILNTCIDLIDELVKQCAGIPVETNYLESPVEETLEARCIEDFFERSDQEKRAILDEVIEKQVQPYVSLDKGSVSITKLEGSVIQIRYEGSCTTCIAATGSTLFAIQKILQTRVHPTLCVQVDPLSLTSVH